VSDPRPLALVTNVVSDYRVEPFRLLAEAEGVEVVAYAHAGSDPPGVPLRRASQLEAAQLVAEGRYRGVVCGLGGRVALPGCYAGARRAGVPFVLWASLWAHPRTPAHALSYLPTRAIYRGADAVVTYGPHVSRYVTERRGRAEGVVEAPQAVDAEHFGRPVGEAERRAWRERAGAGSDAFLALFAGRLEREKGVPVLLDAWRAAALDESARLAFAGDGPLRGLVERASGRVAALGRVAREQLPGLYAAADCLVLPSVPTATFREPWGLVCNEAMHQGVPIIATDAVGAAAGGLVRDGRNGFVVPAGDAVALSRRLELLARAPELRAELGRAARDDVAPYTPAAWARGVREALAFAGVSRGATC
jgi:glycosyltransferase involved in cell wall biosynthesis